MITDNNRLNNLAIFSGKPIFDEKLHVGRPNIGNRESLIKKLNDILDHRWLTNNGPYVQEFERKLARNTWRQTLHRYVQCHHCP